MGSTHYLRTKFESATEEYRRDLCEKVAEVVFHWADLYPSYQEFFDKVSDGSLYSDYSKRQRELLFGKEPQEERLKKLVDLWMEEGQIFLCPNDKSNTESVSIRLDDGFSFCKTNHYEKFGHLAYAMFYTVAEEGYGEASSDCDDNDHELVIGRALVEDVLGESK